MAQVLYILRYRHINQTTRQQSVLLKLHIKCDNIMNCLCHKTKNNNKSVLASFSYMICRIQ